MMLASSESNELTIMGVRCTNLPPHVATDYGRLYDSESNPKKTAMALSLLAAYGDHTSPAYAAAANFLSGKLQGHIENALLRANRVEQELGEVKKEHAKFRRHSVILNTAVRRAAITLGRMSEFDESRDLPLAETLDDLFRLVISLRANVENPRPTPTPTSEVQA